MNKKGQIISWCLYDFANSSYSAVVAAVIFPVYFSKEIAPSQSQADLWWGWAISLSMALVAVSSPIMGGISDYSQRRKPLLIIYTLVAVTATSLLFIPQKGMVLLAFVLIIIANFATEGAFVFYNAYLRDIAEKGRQGRISGWGFGLGYVGSVVSLLVAIMLIRQGNTALVWPFVGGFFLIFSLPAFFVLPSQRTGESLRRGAAKGIRVIISTLKEAFTAPRTRRFLLSYFLYKDAINTIIVFSSLYASSTLSFGTEELILLYLIIQVMASMGSIAFSVPTDKWGAWNVVMLSIIIWILLSTWTYFLKEKETFWIVASVGGFFLGTIQSASRALFCRFIPEGKDGEYFGIYALAGKSSSVIGPALFGLISSLTGNQRNGILFVMLMFFLGAILMLGVRDEKEV
ncbi:MAG: MFS transporter [Nitrospirae bacterium]|nr:MFS transporter [Nitrospirota bacterium]